MIAPATQSRRLAASPYARRLAGERGLALETLLGSGPSGRVVAADVRGFVPALVPAAEAVPVPAPGPLPATAPQIAAFAASVALAALRGLLAAFDGVGQNFDLEDMVLRACGCVFDDTPEFAGLLEASVALELDRRQVVFAGIRQTAPASLRAGRIEAIAGTRDDAGAPAALSLRLLASTGIRPTTMPLLPGRAMRLTVSADAAGGDAECLLTFDAGALAEASAAVWLARFKSIVENPLRLFV